VPQVVLVGLMYLASGAGILLTTAVVSGLYVLSYAIVIGAYYAYGSYQARSARDKARQSFNDSLKDRLVMSATTDGPRSRVYGRCRNVDGILYKGTHGALSEFYTFVIALAGHEIDAVEQVWFSDKPVTLDSNGYVQTEPYAIRRWITEFVSASAPSGSITLPHAPIASTVTVVEGPSSLGDTSAAAPIELTVISVVGNVVTYTGGAGGPGSGVSVQYQYETLTPKARVRSYLGAPGQDLSADLIALGAPDVGTEHKFQGIACLLVTLTFDQEAFAQGIPNFSAVIRGAKILDTRTGLTAWSRNPAMIARDWACYPQGGGCSGSEIVSSMLIASANACDVLHAFTTDFGPVTEPMYVCDLVAPTLTDPSSTMNEIVTSMAGKYAWVGGLLRIKAGFYAAPAFVLDETWLSGAEAIEITAGVPRNDLVNVYRPTIADRDRGYVIAPTEPVIAQAYVTADGQQLPRDVTLLAVTDIVHARHVCGVMLRDARQALTVKIPCNLKAYPVEPFDVGAINLARFGWANKEFEVLSWGFSPTGGVTLTLKETGAFIWDPDALFTSSDEAPNTGLPLPWRVEVPTNLAASSGTIPLSDGSIIARVLLTWDPATTEAVRQSGLFEIQWWPAFQPLPASEDGWYATRVPGGATSTVLSGLLANTTYVFRIRAINSIGIRSQWGAQVVHIVAHVAAGGGGVSDWTDIPGRPLFFRAVSQGYTDTASLVPAGLYDENGATLFGANRSYMLVRLRRSDGVVTFQQFYDVFAGGALSGGRDAAALAADLNATGTDSIVVLYTTDEPRTNRLSGGLDTAIYRCGGSPTIFGSPAFTVRAAYVLIAIGNCGEGNGFEAYCDSSVPTRIFCDVAFQLHGGNLIVTGASTLPGSLADYGYTGTLDATTDIVLIARGNCTVAGNLAEKVGGTTAWDSDVYSRDSAYGACVASATPMQANAHIMFGLNSDPTTDQNFTSLDFAWYVRDDGTALIYENGSNVGMAAIAYAAGDTLVVLYDGSRVRYMQNGQERRVVAATPGLVLFLDSSFYTPGGRLSHIRFGALSANDWASIGYVNVQTGQIGANQVTEVLQDFHDFAGATFNNLDGVRTMVVTPPVNCLVEFTATASGKPYDNDGGAFVRWTVTPAGGTAAFLGGSSAASAARSTAVCAYSFTASAGVALTFSFDVRKGGYANVTLWDTYMRVTLIKR
jgi:Fibronectin type III domain